MSQFTVKQQKSVNYIKHLDTFFEIVKCCDAIHFANIAVYISLFRLWNLCYFSNPFSPTREDIMMYSGLRSKDAYYRNLRELEVLDLIRYYPSRSRFERSFFCISSLEFNDFVIKVEVWGLTNHSQMNQSSQTEINFGNTNSYRDIKATGLISKVGAINGKGNIYLEKTITFDLKENMKNPSINPSHQTSPKQQDTNIPSHFNYNNHANTKDFKSGSFSLRPSGIPIDPEGDYSIPL